MQSVDPKNNISIAWQNEFQILIKHAQLMDLSSNEHYIIANELINEKLSPEEQFLKCWSVIVKSVFLRYPFEFKDAFIQFEKSGSDFLQAAKNENHSPQRTSFLKAHAYKIREMVISNTIDARILNFLQILNTTLIRLEKDLSGQFAKLLSNSPELEILICYYVDNISEPIHSFYTLINDPLFIPGNLIENKSPNAYQNKRSFEKFLEKLEKPYSLIFIDLLEGLYDDLYEKVCKIIRIEIDITYNITTDEIITQEGVNAVLNYNTSKREFE